MQDPFRHHSPWLPFGQESTLVDLGVEVDGKVVGFIFVQRRTDGVGVLESLFVHPNYRQAGHGTGLVRAALRAAREHGVETVEVFALQKEPDAIAWWSRRLGPPNATGIMDLEGVPHGAQGWRLATVDAERRLAEFSHE